MKLKYLLLISTLLGGCAHHTITFPHHPDMLPEGIVGDTDHLKECYTTPEGVTVFAHDLNCPDEKKVKRQVSGMLARTKSPVDSLQGTRLYYTSHYLNCEGKPWTSERWGCSGVKQTFVFYNQDWKRMTRHGLGHLARNAQGLEDTRHEGTAEPPCELYTDTDDGWRWSYEWWYAAEFDGREVFYIDWSYKPELSNFDIYTLGKSQELNDMMNEMHQMWVPPRGATPPNKAKIKPPRKWYEFWKKLE